MALKGSFLHTCPIFGNCILLRASTTSLTDVLNTVFDFTPSILQSKQFSTLFTKLSFILYTSVNLAFSILLQLELWKTVQTLSLLVSHASSLYLRTFPIFIKVKPTFTSHTTIIIQFLTVLYVTVLSYHLKWLVTFLTCVIFFLYLAAQKDIVFALTKDHRVIQLANSACSVLIVILTILNSQFTSSLPKIKSWLDISITGGTIYANIILFFQTTHNNIRLRILFYEGALSCCFLESLWALMALVFWVVDGAALDELGFDTEVDPVHDFAFFTMEGVGGEGKKGEEEDKKELHGFLNYKKKK